MLTASAPKLYNERIILDFPEGLSQLWKISEVNDLADLLYQATLYRDKVLFYIISFSLAENSSKSIGKKQARALCNTSIILNMICSPMSHPVI